MKLGDIELDCWLPPIKFPNPPGDAEQALKETKLQIKVYPINKPPKGLFGVEGLFSAGDGFDVYIDAARFLPDNVTIPKVTARIFNHDFGKLNPYNKFQQLVSLFSCLFSQMWFSVSHFFSRSCFSHCLFHFSIFPRWYNLRPR